MMRKIALLLFALVLTLPVVGQNLKYGLVKDEGGLTNVRKGPGTQYAVVEQLPDGSPVLVLPTGGAWLKAYWDYTDGTEPTLMGYIAASKVVFLARQGELKQVGMVKQEGGYTNVRKGPGTQYAIAEKVKDGSYVLWSGDYSDKWVKVYTQQGKLRGYISASKIIAMESPMF